jgi:hypothetical protein
MSGDNILPFKRRKPEADPIPTDKGQGLVAGTLVDLGKDGRWVVGEVIPVRHQSLYGESVDPPHKGQDLPGHPLGWPYGATVDLGKEGRYIVGEPIDLSESLRQSWGIPEVANTGSIDARPIKPGWSARYGFAATVMLVVAVFAYICATVWAGPWPGDWGRADWIFVGVCLLIGAGYIAAQERRR